MSKQRYLLIIFLLGVTCLIAEVQLQSRFSSLLGSEKTTYLNQSRLEADYFLAQNLKLSLDARLDATDKDLGVFLQQKWLNSYAGLEYSREHWQIQAGYRNLLFGNSKRLQLYPDWNLNLEFNRLFQDQTYFGMSGNLSGVTVSAYGINKQLRSIPTMYIFDENTFEMVPTEMPARSLIDEYYGIDIAYKVTSFLSVNGSTDMKQDNYTATGLYDINTFALGTQIDLKPMPSCKFAGTFSWQNREGESILETTRNKFTTTLRYQQKLGLQTYAFLSLINNSCSDDKLSEVYLISDYVRSHVQYRFPSDPSQQSYLLAGGKLCPENKTNAVFCEAQMRLVPRVYSFVGYIFQPDIQNTMQAKLSYYYNPVSELYLHYQGRDSDLLDIKHHDLGLGTSIRF